MKPIPNRSIQIKEQVTISSLLRLSLFLGVILIFKACGSDSQTENFISGKLLQHSECKNGMKSLSFKQAVDDSISCIQYSFDEQNKVLSITHVNAGFNCCPGDLSCTAALNNDTIVVVESQSQNGCKCNCLYDLEIELNGIEERIYYLRFEEPFCSQQEKIGFNIDLKNEKTGSFCVTRKQYPWGS